MVLGEANIGSARSPQEALNVLSEYARDRYGWRFADGRNMIALMTAALDYLVEKECGIQAPKTCDVYANLYEANLHTYKTTIYLISFQQKKAKG